MNYKGYTCGVCGKTFAPESLIYRCDACYGPLLIEYDYERLKKTLTREVLAARKPGLWKYRELLPVDPDTQPVTLGEGATPMHKADKLGSELAMSHLFLKEDARNPTGAFKDRGTTVGITVAVERGVKAVGTVSHGNMGTSMAAFAARAGLPCYIFAPRNIVPSRLRYLSSYGAKVIQVIGKYDDMYIESVKIAQRHGVMFINCDSPFRTDGQRTLAFEIAEDMNWDVPDWVIGPASSGGMISGLYKGFTEFKKLGLISRLPKIALAQPEDAQPIVKAFENGDEKVEAMSYESETIVRSLGNPDPPSGNRVLKMLRKHGGMALAVPDEETTEAQWQLARWEGVLPEPAGAIALAGLKRLLQKGTVKPHERVVLVVSGFGFRDIGDADKLVDPPRVVKIQELESYVGRDLKNES